MIERLRTWLGLRLVDLGERLLDDEDDDVPAPPQEPITPETLELVVPKQPPTKTVAPEPSPLQGSARERYLDAKRRTAG